MNYTDIRRLFLKIFLGFLTLTAFLAVYFVLNSSFSDFHLKLLGTIFSICAGSICVMSCAAFIEKKGTKEGIGSAGIMAAGLAVLLVNAVLWLEIRDQIFWRITVTFIIATVAIAQICLIHRPRLAGTYSWLQTTATVIVALVAMAITFGVWAEIFVESLFLLIVAALIFVLLASIAVPICSRLGTKLEPSPADNLKKDEGGTSAAEYQLMLKNVSGTLFVDRKGKLYQVTEMKQ